MKDFGHIFHEGLGDTGHVEGREVREAEIEQSRRQAEAVTILENVAKRFERHQIAPGCGPRQIRPFSDLGNREPRCLRRKRPDHSQATLESLDELTRAGHVGFITTGCQAVIIF